MEGAEPVGVVLRRPPPLPADMLSSGEADDILPAYLREMEKSFRSRSKPRRRSWHALTNFDVQWHGICALRYLGGDCLCCPDKLSVTTRATQEINTQTTKSEEVSIQRYVCPTQPKGKKQKKRRSRLFSIEEALGPTDQLLAETRGHGSPTTPCTSGSNNDTLVHLQEGYEKQELQKKDSDAEDECRPEREARVSSSIGSHTVIEHHVTTNEKHRSSVTIGRPTDSEIHNKDEAETGVFVADQSGSLSVRKITDDQPGIQVQTEQASSKGPADPQGRDGDSQSMPGGGWMSVVSEEEVTADARSLVIQSLQTTTSGTDGCHGDTNGKVEDLPEKDGGQRTKASPGRSEIATPPVCHQSGAEDAVSSGVCPGTQSQGWLPRVNEAANGSACQEKVAENARLVENILQTEHVEEYLSIAEVTSISIGPHSVSGVDKKPPAVVEVRSARRAHEESGIETSDVPQTLCETGHALNVHHQGTCEGLESEGLVSVNTNEECRSLFVEDQEYNGCSSQEPGLHSSSQTGSDPENEARLSAPGLQEQWKRFPSPSEINISDGEKVIPFVSELTMQEIRYGNRPKVQQNKIYLDVHKVRETSSV